MTDKKTPESEHIAHLGEHAAAPKPLHTSPDHPPLHAFREADGNIHVVNTGHEIDDEAWANWKGTPRRTEGETVLTDLLSFKEHIGDRGTDATRVYVDPRTGRVDAVIDDDTVAEPGWRRDRITYMPMVHPSWEAWTKIDGEYLSQSVFAEHVEDHLMTIVDPDAATMLELAQTFQASTEIAFRSSKRLSNGETQLQYDETVDATAGRAGEITIPGALALGMPMFVGGNPVEMRARFRYRLASGELFLGVRINDLELHRLAAINTTYNDLYTNLDQPVVVGLPAAPR